MGVEMIVPVCDPVAGAQVNVDEYLTPVYWRRDRICRQELPSPALLQHTFPQQWVVARERELFGDAGEARDPVRIALDLYRDDM